MKTSPPPSVGPASRIQPFFRTREERIRVETQPDGTLVVTGSESMLLMLAVALPALAVVIWILPSTWQQALAWSTLLCGGALLCLTGAERARFVFDPAAQRLTWEKRTIFRRASGEVRFEDITCISLEQAWNGHGGRSNARRVVIHTSAGVIPCSRSYSSGLAGFERDAQAMRATILRGNPRRELPIVT